MYFLIVLSIFVVYLLMGMFVAAVAIKTKPYWFEGELHIKDKEYGFKMITWLWPLAILVLLFVLTQCTLDKVFKSIVKHI